MSVYADPAFWKATFERAVKTAAQTAVALIGTDQAGILALDWSDIGAVVATATVLSILTSIASGAGGDGPSLSNSEAVQDKRRAAPEGDEDIEIDFADLDSEDTEGNVELDESDEDSELPLDR